MSWRDINAEWEADQAFQEAFEEEYPYAGLASSVANLRAANELTQAQLAERVGTTQSVIARLEGGRHGPNVALLRRIAKALDQEFELSFRPVGKVGLANAVAAPNPAPTPTTIPSSERFVIYQIDELFHWAPTTLAGAVEPIHSEYASVIDDFFDVEPVRVIALRSPQAGMTNLFSNHPLGEGPRSLVQH